MSVCTEAFNLLSSSSLAKFTFPIHSLILVRETYQHSSYHLLQVNK